MMLIKENEEARLIWLSLPGNDHPQYYTDTDSDSCFGDGAYDLIDSEEEDRDLFPPEPLTLQEHIPPPSYHYAGASTSKRMLYETDLLFEDRTNGIAAGVARGRRRADVHGRLVSPDAGHRGMNAHDRSQSPIRGPSGINLDDIPVQESFARSLEPDERDDRSYPGQAPGSDSAEQMLYSSDSEEEASRLMMERKRRHMHRVGNRGNKLSRPKGVRWARRGKLGGWTEARMEKEIGDRMRHRIGIIQKDGIRTLIAAMPKEDKDMLAEFPKLRESFAPVVETAQDVDATMRPRTLPTDLSEAARLDAQLGLGPGPHSSYPSEDTFGLEQNLTSTSLAPTLLRPALTARSLLSSHTLRHTFRNPHIGALAKTALDLRESESVLGRAIGRCWAAMERGGWDEDGPHLDGQEKDDVTAVDGGESRGPTLEAEVELETLGSVTENPALAYLDKLFVTKGGLAIPRMDEFGQPIFEEVPPSPGAGGNGGEAAEPRAHRLATTLLPASEQRSVVLGALECIHELAADSREYVERLEEVRSRLASVKRRRAEVWRGVREWALEKEEKGEGEGVMMVDVPSSLNPSAGAHGTSSAAINGTNNPTDPSSSTLVSVEGKAEDGGAPPTAAASATSGAATGGAKTGEKPKSSATGKRKRAKGTSATTAAATSTNSAGAAATPAAGSNGAGSGDTGRNSSVVAHATTAPALNV
ncbi:hypothetical protein IE53DRAFT_383284 [Violaceomyces palustris]|uniref:Uncharacterized protein n=1 Tax=Violaceomyces palustris TaxID=1673888 RepID=A0ACD0P859_9BASI|nr:hypothetical protein IE53DRAFT_383284 [Violaceomyces palustris]